MDPLQLALAAAVACEMALFFFIFCIARFYELKFRESTYHASFLLPVFILAAIILACIFASLGLETGLLLVNLCSLLVMMTTGLFLYRKMMGVGR
ncbi:MAG TPA: hypothetical protein VMC84_01950 [Methanocella sp.]|uniref:hypothetical protein n=1 Tax=Methanocella sp. TaxID=2052833 RepID=UPI002BC6A2C0|nr:hypothetical protein [Methanocella sp.]HTY89917.1 hypothetical protein [Methanocella sp.]